MYALEGGGDFGVLCMGREAKHALSQGSPSKLALSGLGG